MKTKKKMFLSEYGLSMIELSFILPVTLMFIFAGVEFTRSLRSQQIAQNISREMSNDIIRECIGLTDQNASGSANDEAQACIDRHQVTLQQIAQNLIPSSVVYGSLFTINAAGTISAVCSTTPSVSGTFNKKSRIKAGTINCQTLETDTAKVKDISTTLTTTRTVSVGEVITPHTVILRLVPGLFNYQATEHYEVTMM